MKSNRVILILLAICIALSLASAEQYPLFTEDFEGDLSKWSNLGGWSLVERENNTVMEGIEHNFLIADVPSAVESVSFEMRIEQGTLHASLRATMGDSEWTRYFVGFQEQHISLLKQTGGEETIRFLKSGDGVTLNEWHDVTISFEENRLNIYVDDELRLWYRDQDPLTEGGFAFESLDDPRVYVDDVEITSSDPETSITIEDPVTAEAPNVITKRVGAGIIGQNDAEVVFEVSNEDPSHSLQGYLACDVPNDVVVTSAMGAATGESAQYLSQTFVIDPAPTRKSMSLRLSSQNAGSKYMRCTVNYVLFDSEKGYLDLRGQYSEEPAYSQVSVHRDVSFEMPQETPDEEPMSEGLSNAYLIGGILAAVFIVVILFLVYKVGTLSGK